MASIHFGGSHQSSVSARASIWEGIRVNASSKKTETFGDHNYDSLYPSSSRASRSKDQAFGLSLLNVAGFN